MTLWTKRILIFWIGATISVEALPQDLSGRKAYELAESIAVTKPGEAFKLFVEVKNEARQKNDSELYVASINRMVYFFKKDETKRTQIFNWAKEALTFVPQQNRTDQLAQLHFNIGEFYDDLTVEIDAALRHYEKAKLTWILLHGESYEKVADCYHSIGDIMKYKRNDFTKAEQAYEKALGIREKIQLQDLRALFRNHYSLATTNRSQKDFEKALSYGSKTLDIANTLKNNIYQEMTNGVLAGIYRDMGESALAKKHYNIAITLNKKTNDLKTLGWYYQGLGETFKNDSSFDSAITNFLNAYSIYKREPIGADLLIYLLELLADTYALKHDDKKFYQAMDELFKELRLQKMMQSRQAVETFIIFGNYHFRNASNDSALHYYQKGLNAAITGFQKHEVEKNPSDEEVGFNFYVHAILSQKAAVFRKKFSTSKDLFYWKKAMECLQQAERLIIRERDLLDMQDAKWEFLEANYDVYEDIISLLYEGKQWVGSDSISQLAFHYFEQSKSRTLTEALGETERTLGINQNDTLFQTNTDLRRKLLATQDKLSLALLNGNANEVTKFRTDIVDLDRSIQTCKSIIEQKYPGYFTVKYGYQPPSLQTVRETLAKHNRIILEYFWGKESVYALAVDKGRIKFSKVGSPATIQNVINAVVSHFNTNHASTDFGEFQHFTLHAHRLYQLLIQPFHELISNDQHIQIIPDGPIGQVPFEVFIKENSSSKHVDYRSLQYLIRYYTIGYAYSSTMLVHHAKGVIRKPSLLAVGFKEDEETKDGMAQIIGSEQELLLLKDQFDAGKFLIGDDATEANFKKISPNFDIIHLAIHGRGDRRRNFGASLFFKTKTDSLEDGELHAYELYGLKLKAALAVLTACESGLGKGYRGEGMISMASAFTYSGCENILMSLWDVNDQTSKTLMNDYYTQLLDGATIDEALRNAKLNYLETTDELSANPVSWASLVAYGRLDTVFQKSANRIYLVVIAVGLLTVLIIVLGKKKPI